MAGAGSLPVPSIQAHTRAVTTPKAPATRPIVLGETYCDAIPAAAIETIITLHRSDSIVENTRPRNSSGVCLNKLRVVQHARHRHPHPRKHHPHQRRRIRFHLAEQHVRRAVQHVGRGDRALVAARKLARRAHDVPDRSADQQPDPRESPDRPDARRARDETPSRRTARTESAPRRRPSPSPRVIIAIPIISGHAPHVREALAVFVPGPVTRRAGASRARGTRPARRSAQIANAENTKESELMHERPVDSPAAPRCTRPAACPPSVSPIAWSGSANWRRAIRPRVAMVGRIAARPAVKNGDANINPALST